MGSPGTARQEGVPELAALDRSTGIVLLDQAADIGLLTSLGGGYYEVHPALPWYFATLFTTIYGHVGEPAAGRVIRAYIVAVSNLGDYFVSRADSGFRAQIVKLLQLEEANLLHALDLARTTGLWYEAASCMQGLNVFYNLIGRNSEWVRLRQQILPRISPIPPQAARYLAAKNSGAPSPTIARASRKKRGTGLPLPTFKKPLSLGPATRPPMHSPPLLQVSRRTCALRSGTWVPALNDLGDILRKQDDPGCVPLYQEALGLVQKSGDRALEVLWADNVGYAYLRVSELKDLEQAQRWFQYSLSLCDDDDRGGRAANLSALGDIALERFDDAVDAGEAEPVLLRHINAALHSYQQSLDLARADDLEGRSVTEHQIGSTFRRVGDKRQALLHYQKAIQYAEARGDSYRAGMIRSNVAVAMGEDGRISDALRYAHAALDNFRQVGAGAASAAANTEQLIAILEQASE